MNDERGRMIEEIVPQGLSYRAGRTGRTTSWPFPRRLQVFERGLLLKVLDGEVWIPRDEVIAVRRAPQTIRIFWGADRRNVAAITTGFRRRPVVEALSRAGYL